MVKNCIKMNNHEHYKICLGKTRYVLPMPNSMHVVTTRPTSYMVIAMTVLSQSHMVVIMVVAVSSIILGLTISRTSFH